jgi:hypothetical protein
MIGQASKFQHFLAVDWSGAQSPMFTPAIAVAQASLQCQEVRICKAKEHPQKLWSRYTFAQSLIRWQKALRAQRQRALIGIDCNLSMAHSLYSPLLGLKSKAFDLWSYVEACCKKESNFCASEIWKNSSLSHVFWTHGKKPQTQNFRRKTERICRDLKLGSPEDPIKLIGAKQVGKGGLSGMRLLYRLKQELGDELAVWPFEHRDQTEKATLVICEIFPRLFLNQLGYPLKKVSSTRDLDTLLRKLGSSLLSPGTEKEKSALLDHDTDALIAAAGMRALAQRINRFFSPLEMDSKSAETEGWILGVSAHKKPHF